ncbi:hypothetical protein BJP34_34375 [Moorena producens PAL-8-15-08-1]|uniref:Uncharacterized protein n=1 Tax=Moorena producens PAL-8-15-08-1 TaxID=1458985 RepID=A0A1D8U1W8_9CYAN|nr:bacteriocin class II family protein [Moorena producens]AOX03845.1 hypothetical protein BJP34_34375 [Moorena producens PAL-8-15-08-1]
MKIDNLENFQEINTEELSSLEGGSIFANPIEIKNTVEITAIEDIRISYQSMPEEKPEPEPIPDPIKRFPLPRPIHGCYPILPYKCIPGHPPFCAIPL